MTAVADTGLTVFVFWESESWMGLRATAVSRGEERDYIDSFAFSY